MENLKIAFITHATGIGGATISSTTVIQYLVENSLLKPENCIIIHEKQDLPSNYHNDVYFNLKKSIKFYECKLPSSYVIKGTPKLFTFKLLCYKKTFEALFYFIFFYSKILKKEEITTVHLNSFILWPLLLVIPKSMKKIIHIREIPKGSFYSKFAVLLTKRFATRIISIDPVSNKSFSDSEKSIVIYNPINMTQSREFRRNKMELKSKLDISKEDIVISIVGRIEENKGFDFFIKIVENSVQIGNIQFLVAGDYSGEYGQGCVKLLNNYNVKFLGLLKDTREFYAITDIVIRCEDFFPLGRTVWEGIFAGGIALIPITNDDDPAVIKDLLDKYIFLYQASNVASCIDALKMIIKRYHDTVLDSGYPITDNVAISARQFFDEIKS